MKSTKIIQLVLCVVFCWMILAGCAGESGTSTPSESTETTSESVSETTEPAENNSAASAATGASQHEGYSPTAYAEIKIKGYNDPIIVGLDANAAPKTVENFINLAKSGFYDGLTFHRIMDDFMMQGGDPLGTGLGGADTNIEGEFTSNGVDNPLSHTKGAISMARSNDPNSASSQFFIVDEDSTFLDGEYAVFGYVEDGMEVVEDICASAQPIDDNGAISPDAQPVIETITIRDDN